MRLYQLDWWRGHPANNPGLKQYITCTGHRVNKLDDRDVNKAEKVFVNYRRQTEMKLGRLQIGFGDSLTVDNSFPIIHLLVGAWLSLVERSVRDREVGGSNPLAPTTIVKEVDHSPEWSSCL